MIALQRQEWQEVSVGAAPEHAKLIATYLQANQCQYGLCYRMALTIHAGMGQNLDAIVTRVMPLSNDKTEYHLWLKELVIVLLLRTHCCLEIIFVGNKDEKTLALVQALLKRSQ